MDVIDKYIGPFVVGLLFLCAIIIMVALTVFVCRVAFTKRRK